MTIHLLIKSKPESTTMENDSNTSNSNNRTQPELIRESNPKKKKKKKTSPKHTFSTLIFLDENGELEINEEAYFHLHGCTVSYDEIEQMKAVFDRKKDESGKMSFEKVINRDSTRWQLTHI